MAQTFKDAIGLGHKMGFNKWAINVHNGDKFILKTPYEYKVNEDSSAKTFLPETIFILANVTTQRYTKQITKKKGVDMANVQGLKTVDITTPYTQYTFFKYHKGDIIPESFNKNIYNCVDTNSPIVVFKSISNCKSEAKYTSDTDVTLGKFINAAGQIRTAGKSGLTTNEEAVRHKIKEIDEIMNSTKDDASLRTKYNELKTLIGNYSQTLRGGNRKSRVKKSKKSKKTRRRRR
jgi:hypothetical protein